jgi:micrococcal nuclease
VLLVLGVLLIYRGVELSKTSPTATAGGDVQLEKVVDGDTIDVVDHGSKHTVRLIGINTPETVDPRKPVQCFGHEASQKSKDLTSSGIARLEVDPLVGDSDKYGRWLRYVYLPDGSMLNARLVAEGYAYEYTYQSQPYSHQAEFKDAAKQAREHGLGLWSDTTCGGKL